MTSDDQRPPDDSAYPEGDESMSELENADQYVRAHDFIEDLRADRRPVREGSDEDDARLHAMAALLRSTAPDAASVDSDFAARLLARLEADQRRPAPPPLPAAAPTEPSEVPAPVDTRPAQPRTARGGPGVTRRAVLWGSLGAAAAAFGGAAVTAALERSSEAPSVPTTPLVLDGTGAWVAVASLDKTPVGSVVRFEAGAVIGYLQHTSSGFLALSGVCTHMACLLQWNGAERTFDCPCHGGRFLANGKSAPGGRYSYAPLPAIETKVEAGQVWVYVVGHVNESQTGAGGAATRDYGPLSR